MVGGAHQSAGDRPAELMLLTCVLLWSANFSALSYAVERIGPVEHSALRFTIGGALFALVVLWREGSLRIARADIGAVLLLAFVGIFLNQVGVVYAVRDAGAATVAMLMAIAPLVAAALASALGHESISRRHWLGAAVAIVGVVAVIGGSGARLSGGSPLRGGLLALMTAATWGIYSTLVRPLMARYSPLRLSAAVIGAGAVMLVPFAIPQLIHQDWSSPGAGRWSAFAFSAIGALVLTNALWFEGIRRVGAARATLYMYLQPFLGAVIALVLLGEHVHPEEWLGGGAILVGVAVARSARSSSTTVSGEPGRSGSRAPVETKPARS